MTNLDSILKSRDITLLINVYLVKAMVFPVVTYGCESWTIKKAKRRRTVQKELHDPDNHDGVITHLESDILECKVKWALGSITTNKLVEVIESQLSYFKS